MLIDTHCHLNFNSFNTDLEEVIKRARIAGIVRMVVPAIDLSTCDEVLDLGQQFKEIFPAIGIHPNDSNDFILRDIDRLFQMVQNSKVVAVGEIGLDAYHQDVAIKQQMISFEAQLDIANELDLPVLIHNRDADEWVEKCLTKWIIRRKNKSGKEHAAGIMHSFSSSLGFAQRVIEMGFYIGASGPVTYKNAQERRNIFQKIPRDKVVLETDAPFLTPHPFRGKRNEPSYVKYIADEFSRMWDMSQEDVQKQTTTNAARIFRWNELMQQK